MPSHMAIYRALVLGKWRWTWRCGNCPATLEFYKAQVELYLQRSRYSRVLSASASPPHSRRRRPQFRRPLPVRLPGQELARAGHRACPLQTGRALTPNGSRVAPNRVQGQPTSGLIGGWAKGLIPMVDKASNRGHSCHLVQWSR